MTNKNILSIMLAANVLCISCLGIKQEPSITPKKITTADGRTSEYAIDPIFLKRQSRRDFYRTMTADAMKQKLMICFDAARWAASGGNGQPWRFIYAIHGDKNWDLMLNLLKPGNKSWATQAGALVLVVSRTTKEHNGQPLESHSFETGMAVGNFLTQATMLDLVTHPIGGFDWEKACKELAIPAEYAIQAMIVVGEKALGKKSNKEFAEKDSKPSQRKPLNEIVLEGRFS